MKTLFDSCKPRESVFDETKRDDVLDLTNLIENTINPDEFFEENFLTQGMNVLLKTAFKRFRRQSSTGVIKLTQSMGGGKTHNMIILGLLARHPEFRPRILGDYYDSPKGAPVSINSGANPRVNTNKKDSLGKIKVVAFTGRESDAPYGIWGSIAQQLGKKELFKDYYTPLSAPGQTAWVNLLKGEPLLILLDELPPYLENARAKTIGNSDLSVVTINALANLFTALGKDDLSNVCLVISDLKAVYESGSELLQCSFRELENEVNRSALNIEPVGSASDEVYHILRKRLFENLPEEDDITQIANAYKDSVSEAKQMGYTNISPENIFIGIKDSYPFHPSIKDLYARFKENAGFQQTRGLIRLMRIIVSQLYSKDKTKAMKKYLVNVHDFNLNDREMLTTITQIKPSLSNAISHDIASGGKAIAEQVDKTLNETSMQDLSKLLLVSSLSDVPNSLLGLSLNETIGYLCEPDRDITQIKKALDEFIMRAWYLYTDRDGRLFFKNTKNMIAELNTLVDSYDNESAKKELRVFLEEKFKPSLSDCYQKVHVFPAIDEINLVEDKVLLVLFEPHFHGDLHPDLNTFYEDSRYKNRIMFLSGQKNTMDNLLRVAKEHKAIKVIIERMKEEKVTENNPQYQKAIDKSHKTTLNLLQSARETFVTLYYPSKNGILKADFLMEFNNNDFNGEKQVRTVLLQKQKFTEDITDETFRKKCEDRLFTQKEMRWTDIKERAAVNPAWQWHIPRALDDLKNEMLKKEVWRENGGYIEKPPFPKEQTDLIFQEMGRNNETGEVTLKIIPKYGDKVFYEINTPATEASLLIENLNQFKTKELKLYFLCVDSKEEHPTGQSKEWTNKITLQYRLYDKGDEKFVELKSAPKIPVKYTTDGSNPKENGGIYNEPFIVPKTATYVLAVAEEKGMYSDVLNIKIDKTVRGAGQEISIDKTKALTLNKKTKTSDTAQTYKEINLLKKYNADISDILLTLYKTDENNRDKGWIELTIDPTTKVNLHKLEAEIDNIRLNFMSEGRINISLEFSNILFEKGQFFLDWVAEKKLELKSFKTGEIRQ